MAYIYYYISKPIVNRINKYFCICFSNMNSLLFREAGMKAKVEKNKQVFFVLYTVFESFYYKAIRKGETSSYIFTERSKFRLKVANSSQ